MKDSLQTFNVSCSHSYQRNRSHLQKYTKTDILEYLEYLDQYNIKTTSLKAVVTSWNDPLSSSEASNSPVCAAVPHQYVNRAAESQCGSQMGNSITDLPPVQLQRQIDHSAQRALTINNGCSFYFLADFPLSNASFVYAWESDTELQLHRFRFSTLAFIFMTASRLIISVPVALACSFCI